MTDPLRIAIAGLGTVGCGVVKMLQQHRDLIAARAGRSIDIVAVSARDKSKKRNIDITAYEWVDHSAQLVDRADVVVELIGGAEGDAKVLVESALKAGKPVVTANKALLAEHGLSLALLSDEQKAPLLYEAAVAGGIPIIKALREGFAGNEIQAVYGILNGTCNYILSEMRETGRDFDSILKEAQAKGYAEADPSFDVDGIDAAHKLSILTVLAFGVKPAFDQVITQGIRDISAADIAFATELGYRIKLLGIARRNPDGKIMQSMEPCLVPHDSPIGAVEGVLNAAFVEGDFMRKNLLVGRGAGAGPTASAVLSDLIDLARGAHIPVYGIQASALQDMRPCGAENIQAHYYIRLNVLDKPGVLADIAAIVRDHHISVEAVMQRSRNPDQPVSIVMTTHECAQADVTAACKKIAGLDLMVQNPAVMRIEKF